MTHLFYLLFYLFTHYVVRSLGKLFIYKEWEDTKYIQTMITLFVKRKDEGVF